MDRPASSPVVKLAAFAVVLAAAFGGGALVGAVVGPEPAPPSSPTISHGSGAHP
ncbi:MAG: hypothetical protein ABW122_06075 [Ilumatobacteraceae bacterium]